MKLKKLNHRTTALVLAFLIIFVSIPAFATAYGVESNNSENSEPDVPFSFTLEEGDLPFSKLKTAVLDPADIPDVISPALCAERDHVNRLYAQEPDDYTVMFQNRDGSKTTYIFSKPVKSGRSSLSVSALGDETEENAFTYSSDGLEYRTRTQLVSLDRLDKNCIDGNKVYYYNIGYAEITKTGSRLTSSGTDITEEVREWSRGKVTRGGRCAGSSGAVINEEAPGTYVLMYTASEMAGIVNLKNYYSQTYLKNNSLTPVLVSANPNTLKSPSFRWVLQYCNYGRYIIKSMVNINSTQYLLKYNSNFTAVSISSGSSAYQMWKIDEEEDGDGIMYYYLRPAVSGGSGKGLNNSLGFSNVTTGSFNDNCGWELLNKRDIATSISPVSSEAELLVCDYFDLLTTTPSNAELFIDWTCDVPSVLEHDEEEETWYFNSCGVFKLWYHDYYSGLETDSNEDMPIIVFIKSAQYDFCDSATYMIRPIESGTIANKTLTFNTSNNGTFLSVTSDTAIEDTTYGQYKEKWNNKTRTFTFEGDDSHRFYIGATLCRSQQYQNLPIYNNDQNSYAPAYDSTYDSNSWLDYHITDRDILCNYLSTSGVPVNRENACAWRIIPIGSVQQLSVTYLSFVIVRTDEYGNVYSLTNSVTGPVCSSYSFVNHFLWAIYKVGINVPQIKQTTTHYCGYATVLQNIYGAGTSDALIQYIKDEYDYDDDEELSLSRQMNELKILFNNSAMLPQNGFCQLINNGGLPSGVFDYSHLSYQRTNGESNSSFKGNEITNTSSKFVEVIKSGLGTGWALMILTNTIHAPYTVGGNNHYISIIGYDSFSDVVLISNSHYGNAYFGEFSVLSSSLYDSILTLFYPSELN